MTSPVALPVTGAARSTLDWAAELDAVLSDPTRIELVFQPIVDLRRAVCVGWETLSRFTDGAGTGSPWPPDVWFAAADARGVGARLEAIVVRRVLDLLPTLPPDCFLAVNVSPHLLTQPELAGPLLATADLSGLVLELTEHQSVSDLRPLIELRDLLHARGALVALDDAGSGYSGLQQITQFRPQIIKLDRALVAEADKDEVKLALAELLGAFGERIEASLLAEGIETWGEMEAFLRLGVPLGQGWLLGRPGPRMAPLDPEVAARLQAEAARSTLVEHVASLVETVPLLGPADPVGGLAGDQTAVAVDLCGHPTAVLLPRGPAGGAHRVVPVSLCVPSSTGLVEVARRLAARPADSRFDPVVCVDAGGAAVGLVRVERLLLRLAEGHES